MKDLTGRTLETGDLILDIRTNWEWHNLGVVHGGVTKGGQVRYVSVNGGFKTRSKSKCLLKITREQFEETFGNINVKYENYKNFIDSLKIGHKQVMEIHNRINN